MKQADFNSKDLWAVALALGGLGIGWAANHQAAVMTATAMSVTWAVNVLAKRYGVQLGRRWLTVILYVLAVALEVIFEPVRLPALPMWAGDPAAYAQGLVDWAAAVAAIGAGVTAGATVLYNTLLHEVSAKLAGALTE